MNETRTIFLVGKPGSGKGTQAKILSEATGWKTFAASDELRAFAAKDTPVGNKVKSEMEAGLLVPHWLVQHLFLEAIFSIRENESVIFDGFSRKVPEAEFIIDALRWMGRPFTLLNLAVSDEEVRHRLDLRKGIEGRVDDSAIEERLKEYRANTDLAIEKFRESGNLIEINGEQSREAIAADIKTALGIS